MLFWLVASVMTVLASLAVLMPLTARPRAVASDGANDLRVYRDQLAEVDRDLARGALAPGDAEQARAEIGRRIVRTAEANEPVSTGGGTTGFRAVTLAAVLSIPAVSWGLYSLIGAPDLPSQPLEARLNKPANESSTDELIARAENYLAKNPDAGRGWDAIAPAYLRLGRYNDAIIAFRNAIRLEGETAARTASLGEAVTLANGGIVSAEAEAVFKRALALEPNHGKAAFFLAMGQAQDGNKAEAIAAWEAMLQRPETDATWRRAAEYALAQSNRPAEDPGAPGPSQDQMDAAASMSPQDRAAMVEGMVAGLDEKLKANPNDPEGWIRLVRSYLVLGRPDDAKSALKRAMAALGDDTASGKRVAAFAAGQGVSLME